MDKWVLVGINQEGVVGGGCIVGYENEQEFRQEYPECLYVPGPIALGEPLTADQKAMGIKDLNDALNELRKRRIEDAPLFVGSWC